jgi:HemY protein
MIKLWLFLFFLAGLGFAATWVADHPGNAVIYWLDYRIDTSFAVLGLTAILVAWFLVYFHSIVHHIATAPKRLQERRQLKNFEHGLRELTYSVSALAGSDLLTAEKHAQKAQRFLGQTPMGLLISAQIARTRGDEEKTRALLDVMLKHKETSQIATRLLNGPAEPPASKVYVWGQKLRSFIHK